jgi:hypothetical protein
MPVSADGTKSNWNGPNGWVEYARPCEFPVGATCSDTNGAVDGQPAFPCGAGYAAKPSAADVSIEGLVNAPAKALCCDAVYPEGATCASAWTGVCPEGTKLDAAGLINGLVVGSAAAQDICCVAVSCCCLS